VAAVFIIWLLYVQQTIPFPVRVCQFLLCDFFLGGGAREETVFFGAREGTVFFGAREGTVFSFGAREETEKGKIFFCTSSRIR
jgi:hypothetical protein